jgi:hypothetical protein
MKKKLQVYLKKLSLIEYSLLNEEEKRKQREALLVQIQFFQHERMIHLIVTALVAILEVLSLLACLLLPSMVTFSLVGLFLILLVPYIYHYYILENGVQKMYEYYEDL